MSEKKEFCSTEFVLKQITPMIHFQYDQDGATVRATEMKPKLDRLILELRDKFSKLSIDQQGINEWKELFDLYSKIKNWDKLILPSENGSQALNYKLRIFADGLNSNDPDLQVEYRGKGVGAYFFSNDDEHSRGTFYSRVRVKILCFNKELLAVIKKVFEVFIALNSFGFRQNKGFGRFVLQNQEVSSVEQWIEKYVNLFDKKYCLYKVSYKEEKACKYILNQINQINQEMKSGRYLSSNNTEPVRIPSYLLKKYKPGKNNKALGKIFTNEKKYMKQKLLGTKKITLKVTSSKAPDYDKQRRQYSKARYFRGILGFAEQYEFRDVELIENSNGIQTESKKYNIAFKYEYIYKNQQPNEQIRFSSPISYLPVGVDESTIKTLYLLVNIEQVKEIQKKQVRVKIIVKDKDENNDMNQLLEKITFEEIPLLGADEFDIEEFMDHYIEYKANRKNKWISYTKCQIK